MFRCRFPLCVGVPDAKWKTAAEHKVTIINDDGKAASWNYKIT